MKNLVLIMSLILRCKDTLFLFVDKKWGDFLRGRKVENEKKVYFCSSAEVPKNYVRRQ
jgi:hypothetical protein